MLSLGTMHCGKQKGRRGERKYCYCCALLSWSALARWAISLFLFSFFFLDSMQVGRKLWLECGRQTSSLYQLFFFTWSVIYCMLCFTAEGSWLALGGPFLFVSAQTVLGNTPFTLCSLYTVTANLLVIVAHVCRPQCRLSVVLQRHLCPPEWPDSHPQAASRDYRNICISSSVE